MEWLLQNPLALWMVIGAVLLAVEVATDSGWLLWPAGSAALTGAVAQGYGLDLNYQFITFAILTIITTLAGRRFFPRPVFSGHDINDTTARLAGSEGIVTESFEAGLGRVFVDGKEWAAELENGGALAKGEKITVTAVGGARLKVRPK